MKRSWLFYTIIFVIFSFTFTFSMLAFSPYSKSKNPYTSPLPDFLTLSKNNQVRILDLWEPLLEAVSGRDRRDEDFTAKSILMYDLESNKTLFEKNPKERLPMASLTKIMTAIVALENKNSDDRYVVRGSDLVGEDSMGLGCGEILTS